MFTARGFITSVTLCLFLTGCSNDPLERAALYASRVGTTAGEGRGGADSVGLEASARVMEEIYWVAKYEATLQQRQVATEAAKRAVAKIAVTPKSTRRSRKTPRYLAVRTRSDERAKTKTSVMIWDTEAQQIVGNNVYDLNATPPSETVVKFETYAAQYVGSGE